MTGTEPVNNFLIDLYSYFVQLNKGQNCSAQPKKGNINAIFGLHTNQPPLSKWPRMINNLGCNLI